MQSIFQPPVLSVAQFNPTKNIIEHSGISAFRITYLERVLFFFIFWCTNQTYHARVRQQSYVYQIWFKSNLIEIVFLNAERPTLI